MMMHPPSRLGKTDWAKVGTMTGLFALVVLLWWTPAMFPLKILVVFFHELSHGLMALATGGQIQRIEISIWQGGVCWVSGGNTFLVYSAGYLGSLVCGGILLIGATRTKHDKQIAIALGALLILVSLRYIAWFSFGWFFCVVAGLGLAAAGWWLPGWINEVGLMTIGLVSCLYAPLDILDDTVLRQLQESDASRLGELTSIPGIVWGLAWTLIAVACTLVFVFIASRKVIDSHPETPFP